MRFARVQIAGLGSVIAEEPRELSHYPGIRLLLPQDNTFGPQVVSKCFVSDCYHLLVP